MDDIFSDDPDELARAQIIVDGLKARGIPVLGFNVLIGLLQVVFAGSQGRPAGIAATLATATVDALDASIRPHMSAHADAAAFVKDQNTLKGRH